jgi:hypothetical protein
MKMMVAHIRNTPQAPSQHSEFSVSRDLDEVVLACLEKDPANRPATADDLAARLVASDVGESWTAAQSTAWWRQHLPELSKVGARA